MKKGDILAKLDLRDRTVVQHLRLCGGGAKRSGAGADGQLMIAEATAAKLREEASAMQERLAEAEQSVGKQQRARRGVDAKVVRLADDKATLERELERLGAEMEALRRTRAQPPAPSPEAELSAAVRRERAAAVCGRRVEAARRASLRTTLPAWGQFAQTASWLKPQLLAHASLLGRVLRERVRAACGAADGARTFCETLL